MSFFNDFAKDILPDSNRNPEEGDYYGSPLAKIGVSQAIAFQVETEFMHFKTGSATLKDWALKRDFNDPIYQLFKDNVSTIVLAETLLTVIPNTASSLNPNFFDGANDYFKKSSNTHDAEEKIFSHLVLSCLSVVWQSFKNEKRCLPAESDFDPQLVSVINNKNPSLTRDCIEIYHSLYKHAFPENLTVFLDQNLDAFLNRNDVKKAASCFTLHGLAADNPVRGKQRLFHNGSNAPYKLIFNSTPWSLFLHNFKKVNTIDYSKPSDHFPFHTKHPAPSLLWTTLLLIDLHEQLSATAGAGTSGIETNSMNISDLINTSSADLTVDAKTENPKPCRQVYQELRQRGTHRFASAKASQLTLDSVSTERPWLLDQLNDDLNIEQASADHACTISLKIPESVFESLSEPTVLIDIHVFYYHEDLRSTLPCALTQEYNETEGDQDIACFQVELDWDYMHNLAFEPLKTSCLAGLVCNKGKADIVVVFAK